MTCLQSDVEPQRLEDRVRVQGSGKRTVRLGFRRKAQGCCDVILAQLRLRAENDPGNAGKIDQVAIERTEAFEIVIIVMREVGMYRRLDESKLEVSITRRNDRIPAEVEERSPGLPPADSRSEERRVGK